MLPLRLLPGMRFALSVLFVACREVEEDASCTLACMPTVNAIRQSFQLLALVIVEQFFEVLQEEFATPSSANCSCSSMTLLSSSSMRRRVLKF